VQGKAKILVVDDDEDLCYIITRTLEKMGYEVLAVASGPEAILAMTSQRFCLALVDINTPDVKRREAILRMRQYDPQMPVVLMTGSPGWPDAELQMTCQERLHMPFRLEELRSIVKSALGESNRLPTF